MTKCLKKAASIVMAMMFVVSGCMSLTGSALPVDAADNEITITHAGKNVDGNELEIPVTASEAFSVAPEEQDLEASYDKDADSVLLALDEGQNVPDDYKMLLKKDQSVKIAYTASASDAEGNILASRHLVVTYKADDKTSDKATRFSPEDPTKNSVIVRAPKKAPAAAPAGVHLQYLNAQAFYGGKKASDGSYVWTVPDDTDQYKPGHQFSFRINFALDGGTSQTDDETVAPGKFTIRIPKHILKNRSNADADEMEWSIPSQADVQSATKADGTIDSGLIDEDIDYAYYDGGNAWIIYNFRPVRTGTHGYVEVGYKTTESSFSYVDMKGQSPFNATGTVENNQGEKSTLTTSNIIVKIDTTAKLTDLYKRRPYTRITAWDNSWGTASSFGISNPSQYDYLVWDIRMDTSATQPYNLTFDETAIKGNHDTNNAKVRVIGIKGDSDSAYTKVTNNVATLSSVQTDGRRWYQVLTAIPLSVYQSQTYWRVDNNVKVTLTPVDKVDKATTKSSSAVWEWTKPVFHEPSGRFNSFKRGDGGYRTYCPEYSVFTNTQHWASSVDFKAGEYSRYDLELFNGWDGKRAVNKTKTTFENFDYASWMVGYPYPWTRDGAANNPASYGKKNVKYVLSDEGVYLITDPKALTSDDGSSKRTIGNGISANGAIALTHDDFRIDSIGYSWYMLDADWDSVETGEWQTKSATYKNGETLVFEGKFGGSNTWTQFATYNLYNNQHTSNDTYVDSMSNHRIVMKDGVDLTAYRVTTSNAHYYTEVFTVPNMSLKNSAAVMKALDHKTNFILLNNDNETVYDSSNNRIISVDHSDTDYATVSQRESILKKSVIGTGNNARRKYYTLTWDLSQKERIQTGEGEMKYIPQKSGIFYDLLPNGAQFVKGSVQVQNDGTVMDESSYTVNTIDNYQNTGRTLLIVNVKDEGQCYDVTFQTRHSWDAIKDYGNTVYNPVAYETGNDSITDGYPDNGGTSRDGKATTSPIKNPELMNNIAVKSGVSKTPVTAPKFLYAGNEWDIAALTSASSGLRKKVKASEDSAYSDATKTHINGSYSYELRFMNSYSSTAKNIVFYDSLENYNPDNRTVDGRGGDWKGILTGVDTNQLVKKGINPVVYISTRANPVQPETEYDLRNTSVWTRVTGSTDLSKATAVAIDASVGKDGKSFTLGAGDSVVAYLYMKAPAVAPAPKAGSGLPYAYNNLYIRDVLTDDQGAGNTGETGTFMIHQDYTKISLIVTGNADIHKISSKTQQPIKDIEFNLSGTSAYGTIMNENVRTDKDGDIHFKDLEMGTYQLREIDATDDYLLDPTVHTVQITNTGHTVIDGRDVTGAAFTIQDPPRVHADVEFEKVDSMFTATKLSGAEYRLSGTSDYGTDVLMTAVSSDGGKNGNGSDKGLVTFVNIEKGKYALKETKAPDGYILDPTEYTVTIDADANVSITYVAKNGNVVAVDLDKQTPLLKDEPLHFFTFTKLSAYDNTVLAGAEFSLIGTSDLGTEVNAAATSDAAGTVKFENLEPGTYVLKETKAPKGYDKDELSHVVTMHSDGTFTISGLTKNGDTYEMFDPRQQNEQITVTKVWDDGENAYSPGSNGHTKTDENGNVVQDPSKLGMTIQTGVPQGSTKRFTIVYDANGGSFGNN